MRPFVRREHRNQHPDNGPRRIELTALLTLRCGELPQEVFVYLAQHVLRLVFRSEADFRDEVDELSQARRLNLRPGKSLVQDVLQRGIEVLNLNQGLVQQPPDLWLLRLVFRSEADFRDEVDELSQARRLNLRPGKSLVQDVLQRGIEVLNLNQ